MNKGSLSSHESGIGHSENEGSAVEEFFKDFVPRLSTFARGNDELLDDPTIDLDLMAVCKAPQQPSQQTKKIRQPEKQQCHPQRTRMIMAENSNKSSNSCDSGRDLSFDEINLIVSQLRGGGPYSEKLVSIMLKGLEKTLSTSIYRTFLEFGLPENWCPIVKMNNDNTPFVEFLIKSDLSDQDPFSQLSEYSTEHMGLCKFVVNSLHESATLRRQPELAPPPAKRNPMLPQQQQQQQQQKQQQQLQQQQKLQQQRQQMSKPQLQRGSSLLQKIPQKHQSNLQLPKTNHTLGDPIACSTPKSQRQRVLPPRACKSLNRSGLQY